MNAPYQTAKSLTLEYAQWQIKSHILKLPTIFPKIFLSSASEELLRKRLIRIFKRVLCISWEVPKSQMELGCHFATHPTTATTECEQKLQINSTILHKLSTKNWHVWKFSFESGFPESKTLNSTLAGQKSKNIFKSVDKLYDVIYDCYL